MLQKWTNALELDDRRNIIGGSPEALRDAIRRGADQRAPRYPLVCQKILK